jgi:Raf kinase inhibitor-like YbhB/YbcL family protein
MTNNPFERLADVPAFDLTSPDFSEGDVLPQVHRSGIFGAGGEDVSPELNWAGAPAGTKSFVVTVYDPDAPTMSGFWHWAVFNLPASLTGLPRDAGNPDAGLLPEGAITLKGDGGVSRFLGAAPPAGHGPHRYFFIVTALDVESLELPADATPALLSFQANAHALGRAVLSGTSETPAE